MNERDLALSNRILEKCQSQCWYGGDEYNTVRFSERNDRYEEYINPQGNPIVTDKDPDDHPRKSNFACSPATEEQLLATEQALGFPLPSFLRLLYSHIANGGFGPGYGLIGALGGFDEAGDIVDMYQYHKQRSQLIEFEQYPNIQQSGASLELPDTVWPRFMLYLCDWGDARVSCIDCATERVFLVHLGEKYYSYIVEAQASSLQEWWEQWLERTLQSEELESQPLLLSQIDDTFDPFADDELLP